MNGIWNIEQRETYTRSRAALERIAEAAERIADSMEGKPEPLRLTEPEADFLRVMLQRYYGTFCDIDKGAAQSILKKLQAAAEGKG